MIDMFQRRDLTPPSLAEVFQQRLREERLRPELTQERVRELFYYDEEEGVLYWKKVNGKNSIQVGSKFGAFNDKHTAYIRGHVDGRLYYAHSLIWLYVHGRWPEGEIDHIDRDGTNNRLSNLREVDQSVQAFNQRLKSSNTSGHRGVHWCRSDQTWHVDIGDGCCGRIYLGSFFNFEDAVAVRHAAEIERFGEILKD
jgi:hypothetical protein